MTRLLTALTACALIAPPALAGNVDDIRVALPEIVELAEIQPGLLVVTRLDIEVFALDGAYWLKSDGRWYSARRPLEGFQAVEPRAVPPALAKLPKGAYLDYRPAEGQLITQRRVTNEAPGAAPAEAAPAKAAPRAGTPAAVPLPPPPVPKAEAKAAAPAPKPQPPPKKAPAKPAAKPAPPPKPADAK